MTVRPTLFAKGACRPGEALQLSVLFGVMPAAPPRGAQERGELVTNDDPQNAHGVRDLQSAHGVRDDLQNAHGVRDLQSAHGAPRAHGVRNPRRIGGDSRTHKDRDRSSRRSRSIARLFRLGGPVRVLWEYRLCPPEGFSPPTSASTTWWFRYAGPP